ASATGSRPRMAAGAFNTTPGSGPAAAAGCRASSSTARCSRRRASTSRRCTASSSRTSPRRSPATAWPASPAACRPCCPPRPRGVGGLFFDQLPSDHFAFVRDAADAFLEAYVPIVARRKQEGWGERERQFQLLRRGRYVEFNLLYDRGTVFGLKTDGRTESILMSLPPRVRWGYDEQPAPGSREAELVAILKSPRDWG